MDLKGIGCWNLGRWVSISGRWVMGWVIPLETVGGNWGRQVSTRCWLGCQMSVHMVLVMMGIGEMSVTLWIDGWSTEWAIDQCLYNLHSKAPSWMSVYMGFTFGEMSDQLGVIFYCIFETVLYFYQSMCGCLVVPVPVHHRGSLYILPRFVTLGWLLPGTFFILRVSPGGWTGIHKENIKFPVNSKKYKLCTVFVSLFVCLIIEFLFQPCDVWGLIETFFFSANMVFQGRLIEFFFSAWWSFLLQAD